MRIYVKYGLCLCALVALTRPSQTKGQVSPLAPILTPVAVRGQARDSIASIPPFNSGDQQQVPRTVSRTPEGWVRTTAPAVSRTSPKKLSESGMEAVNSNGATPQTPRLTSQAASVPAVKQPATTVSAVPGSPSLISKHFKARQDNSTQVPTTLLAGKPFITSTPGLAAPAQGTTPAQPFTEPRAEVTTPARTLTPTAKLSPVSSPSHVPVGPTHQEVPSELNVGDDVFKGHHRHANSPLDPLLAGLVSALIVTTAIVSVVLFLKFRQRTDNPEFHRLQDLPMDDLMEDTPLSRYAY